MKTLFLFLFLISQASYADCTCKCVTKDEAGKFSILEGKGKDREAAGEDLKKNLKKQKCEISPTCSGKCSLD